LLVSGLYVVVCRLLELVVLVGRGDRAKELEILVLATSCRFFAARSIGRALRRTTGFCWRRAAGCFRAARGPPSLCGRRHSWRGIVDWSLAGGPTRTAAQAGRRSTVRCAN
jgi:hypothetical protein